MSDIVIFEEDRQPVEVRLEGETVWLSQKQMAELFGKDLRTINEHVGNVYEEGELGREATIRKFRIVRQEGNRQVRRAIDHYNLDVIISVGYRVKSQRGVRFRQWATRVLREHLTQGYSFNEHRLARQGLAELEQAVELLGQPLTRQELVSDIGQEVVGLILGYARTWRLLQDYDEGALGMPPGARPARGVLGVDEARRAPVVLRDQEPSLLGWQQALRGLPVLALPAPGRHAPDLERAGLDRPYAADRRKRSQGQGSDGTFGHEPDCGRHQRRER